MELSATSFQLIAIRRLPANRSFSLSLSAVSPAAFRPLLKLSDGEVLQQSVVQRADVDVAEGFIDRVGVVHTCSNRFDLSGGPGTGSGCRQTCGKGDDQRVVARGGTIGC
jgi:hypothetical protein